MPSCFLPRRARLGVVLALAGLGTMAVGASGANSVVDFGSALAHDFLPEKSGPIPESNYNAAPEFLPGTVPEFAIASGPTPHDNGVPPTRGTRFSPIALTSDFFADDDEEPEGMPKVPSGGKAQPKSKLAPGTSCFTVTSSICGSYVYGCGKGCYASAHNSCRACHCNAGSYSAPYGYVKESGGSCTACPGGRYEPTYGQSSCRYSCPGGYYCPSGSSTYYACPGVCMFYLILRPRSFPGFTLTAPSWRVVPAGLLLSLWCQHLLHVPCWKFLPNVLFNLQCLPLWAVLLFW